MRERRREKVKKAGQRENGRYENRKKASKRGDRGGRERKTKAEAERKRKRERI